MKRAFAIALLILLGEQPSFAQVIRPGDPHWKAPVATAADLPMTGNQVSDTRRANDTQIGYSWNGTTWVSMAAAGVSVGLTMPSWLAVSGSPVTTPGTLAVTPATGQTSHRVIGTCGSATSFSPCALVASDLPALPYLSDATAYAGSASQGGAATTAVALAANGSNCSSGQAARGVDASGAAEGCFAPSGASPAGSGTELQHRVDASTFGAVAGSSYSGSVLTLPAGVKIAGASYPALILILGDDDTGIGQQTGNGVIRFWAKGAEIVRISDFGLRVTGGGSFGSAVPQIAAGDRGDFTHPQFAPDQGDSMTGMVAGPSSGLLSFTSTGVEVLRTTATGLKVTDRIQLVAASGITCDSSTARTMYSSADGSLCWCNGSVWTPTPLTGSCS